MPDQPARMLSPHENPLLLSILFKLVQHLRKRFWVEDATVQMHFLPDGTLVDVTIHDNADSPLDTEP